MATKQTVDNETDYCAVDKFAHTGNVKEDEPITSSIPKAGNEGQYATSERSSFWSAPATAELYDNWRDRESTSRVPMQRRPNCPNSQNNRPFADDKSIMCMNDYSVAKLLKQEENPSIIAEWRNENPLPPSKIKDEPWVHACFQESDTPESASSESENVIQNHFGKWMLFRSKTYIDQYGYSEHDYTWLKVKYMTANGTFCQSKASTGMPNPNALSAMGVTIIYTEDYTDVADVIDKAREIISNFLILKPFYYKTDEATLTGKYRIRGFSNVSLYRCNVDGQVDKRDEEGKWQPIKV